MIIVKWLNDNNVLISKRLADTMAAFEIHNCGTIDELASELVKELVNFSKKALEDSDNFYHDDDHARKIYNLISEDAASRELYGAINKIEDRLHEWKIGDELDNLIVEIIVCTVESTTHGSNGAIVSVPSPLEELMEKVTPENMHPETDWGRPVGKEFW